MHFPRLKTGVILSFAVLAIGSGCIAFVNLDKWLEIADPLPDSLDVLFTLSGEESRLAYSVELFAKRKISFWLVSSQDKNIMKTFLQRGLDTSRIYVIDTCSNTRSEIAFLDHWLTARGMRKGCSDRSQPEGTAGAEKVGIVSNWYHMRRIQLIVMEQFKKRGPSCSYFSVPCRFDWYQGARKGWWRQRVIRDVVFLEWGKILYYIFKHPLLVCSMLSIGR
jgi:uncharacterized SAM-binding protein YcdF (DUF218 family)